MKMKLPIDTARLRIMRFELSMAREMSRLSLDAENRRFMPDEVFETEKDAKACMKALIAAYDGRTGPFVFPVLLKAGGALIGHVEAAPLKDGWEIGCHIGEACRGHGYAAEAIRALTPRVLKALDAGEIVGICRAENEASARTLENAGYAFVGESDGFYQGAPARIRTYRFTRRRGSGHKENGGTNHAGN